MSRGVSIQVQTNIRGIDPTRTDVVTVSTPALLRPDVKVNSVSGPGQAPPNSAVSLLAEVAEGNGDVGARADCVLSIDGTAVSSTPGIWVDAADTVTCAFSHAFSKPGTYTVAVSARNVTPGDWDASNNQAQTSITILEPGRKIERGSLQAWEIRATGIYTQTTSDNSARYDSKWANDYSHAYFWGDAGVGSARCRSDPSH